MPEVIKLIAGLVHKHAPVAEQQYGPGTGPAKFGSVFAKVISDLQNAAAAGAIPKELPTDEAIKAVIESVVTSLNLQGLLGAPNAPAATQSPGTQAIKLAPGGSVTVSA